MQESTRLIGFGKQLASDWQNTSGFHRMLGVILGGALAGLFYFQGPYAFHDDYLQAWFTRWGGGTWRENIMYAEGRPLYSWIVSAAWSFPGGVAEITSGLRIFGMIGLLGIVAVWGRFLAGKLEGNGWKAGAVATVAILNPGAAVYAFWAATSPYAWGGLLATWAGVLAYRAGTGKDKRSRLRAGAWAFGLGLGALCIYQSAIGFFLLPVLFLVILRPQLGNLKSGVWVLGQFGLLLVCYFILYKLSSTYLFPDNLRAARGGNLALIRENFLFSVTELLPFMAKSWAGLAGNHPFAQFVPWGVAAAFGVWWISAVKSGGAWVASLALILLMVGTLLTEASIIGSSTLAPYRTQAATIALLTVWSGTGLYRLAGKHRLLGPGLVVLGVVVLGGSTRLLTEKLGVSPAREEYSQFTKWLETELKELPATVTLVQPQGPREQIAPWWSVNEFGDYSSPHAWAAGGMFYILLAERFELEASPRHRDRYLGSINLEIVDPHSAEPWYAGKLLDLRELLGQPQVSVFAPLDEAPLRTQVVAPFGEVSVAPNGWFRHDQIGWLKPRHDGKFHHDRVGLLAIEQSLGGAGEWIWTTPDSEQWVGSPEDWPHLRNQSSNEVISLLESLEAKRQDLPTTPRKR